MSRRSSITIFFVFILGSASFSQEKLELRINPDRVLNHVDEKIYGHFLEHIYHSCNGGLWGELVWNRSFEQNAAGMWSVQDDIIRQKSSSPNVRLGFGDTSWSDYEISLQARKEGGSEGFLVLFRVAGPDDFYWVNLGGWNNQRHGMERGRRGEGRWRPVGPTVEGGIEKDRWYDIRIRCEGPHFQVWLDHKLLIDFTDDTRAHLRGKAGIGTWSTQAAFRNLQVKALDGRSLFQGLPEEVTGPAVAYSWSHSGTGEVYLDSENSLNSEFCQRLVNRNGPVAIEQSPLRVDAEQIYRGSLWARGSAQSLTVQLVDDEGQLAQAELPQPSETWKELPFELRPNRPCDHATLRITAEGPADVQLDQVSLMPALWAQAGGFRPDLLQAVAGLQPPIIRWPGGCFASAYRWKDAIGPQHQRRVYPIEIWDDRDVNSFGTDEFIAMCRLVGAEPLIVVNIGTPAWRQEGYEPDYLQDLLDWIEYCNGPADSKWGKVRAANGHPEPYGVKYWEIDNETWQMGVEAYASAVREIAPKMKEKDPTIRLAACGSGGSARGGIGLSWNKVIIEQCSELIDYLSIHHYENPDQFADGPRRYEEFFRDTASLIRQSQNPNLKIYVSEWNAQSTDWRTGLYAAGLLNAFERCGDVLEIGGPALFLRHVSASAWDNAFINFDHRGWFPAPNYSVMKLWREHSGPNRVEVDGPAEPINCSVTQSPDLKMLFFKAVNPREQSVDIELQIAESFPIQSAELKMISPGSLQARNTLASPSAIHVVSQTLTPTGQTIQFHFPSFSTIVLAIRQDGAP